MLAYDVYIYTVNIYIHIYILSVIENSLNNLTSLVPPSYYLLNFKAKKKKKKKKERKK